MIPAVAVWTWLGRHAASRLNPAHHHCAFRFLVPPVFQGGGRAFISSWRHILIPFPEFPADRDSPSTRKRCRARTGYRPRGASRAAVRLAGCCPSTPNASLCALSLRRIVPSCFNSCAPSCEGDQCLGSIRRCARSGSRISPKFCSRKRWKFFAALSCAPVFPAFACQN